MFIDNLYPGFTLDPMGNKPSSPVHTCLRSAVKDVVFPSDPLFGLKHVKPYNLGVPSKPSAVTYPKSTDDIAKIVKCAVDNSLKVQARCGGHSFANYGVSYLFRTWAHNSTRKQHPSCPTSCNIAYILGQRLTTNLKQSGAAKMVSS
jgi:hypothetical protein